MRNAMDRIMSIFRARIEGKNAAPAVALPMAAAGDHNGVEGSTTNC